MLKLDGTTVKKRAGVTVTLDGKTHTVVKLRPGAEGPCDMKGAEVVSEDKNVEVTLDGVPGEVVRYACSRPGHCEGGAHLTLTLT